MASAMTDIDVRPSLSAASAAAVLDRVRAEPRAHTETSSLSPEALAVADAPTPAPISPIVLAGFVRMAEFALIVVVGLAIFAVYLPTGEGLFWRYLAAILAIATLSMLAFQTADIYQVQAFRGHEKQYMRLASAWSVVFLIVIGASFFAKAGEMFSRVWLGSFYVSGLARADRLAQAPVPAGAQMDARRPPHPAHGDRRRRRFRRARDRGAAAAKGFRRQDHRRVRRSRRRPQRYRLRRRAQARHRRRSGRIRPAHARRSGDLFAADLGGRPHPADAEEIVGAAGRHPARRAHQQAAIPPALLFLYRQCAGARRVRPADRRLGRGDEMAVRQDHRRHHAARSRCR